MEQEQKTIVNEKQPANVDKRKQRKILSPKKTATITKRTAKKLVKKLKKPNRSGKRRKSKPAKRKMPTKKKGKKIAKKKVKHGSKKIKKTTIKKPLKRLKKVPGVKRTKSNTHPPARKEKVIQTKDIRVLKKKNGGSMEVQAIPQDGKKSEISSNQKENGLMDPEKMPFKKVSNVFNVGQYIRKQSTLNVSPGFVHEIVSRIKDQIDVDVIESDKVATAEGMKTLMEKHAVHVYDFKIKEKHRIVTCTKCGGVFAVSNSHANGDSIQCCPFCMKKGSIEIA